MTVEHDTLRELLAPVALGAAEPAEVARVEAHADGCAECRAELQELREDAAVLALSVPLEEPPARLKRSLMATVRREAAAAQATAPARPRARRRWRLRGWPALAAAACAVALALVGLNVALLVGSDDDAPADPALVALDARGTGGLAARVLLLPEHDRAIVTLEGARRLGATEGYELWVLADGHARSAGFLVAEGPARASLVASGLRDAEALAVTREPHANTRAPSGPPLVRIPMPA